MYNFLQIQQLLESEVEGLSFGTNPPNLYEPMRYIMSLGGKRIRPTLVVLSYQLFKSDLKKILRPALAVEVFHNFTLMHDDIMDAAPLRRGKPTVHEKWNQTVAILSGDTMLVKAYDLLMEIDSGLLSSVFKRFNQTAVEVCEGQQIDMNFETQQNVDEDQYIEMIRLKTAVLLGFSMEMGGMLANQTKDVQNQLYKAGETIGIGFQLMDDYLDVYADTSKFGKQVGGDILANKRTFLLIKALELANQKQKKELLKWIGNFENPSEKIKAITNLYDEIGVPKIAKERMQAYFDDSRNLIAAMQLESSAYKELTQFLDILKNREK